jgi:hypothetical protein
VSENGSNPFDRVVGSWEAVVADMDDVATEYRRAGWEVLELHPGDVAVLDEERFGLEVLVPDDEFDRLEGWVDAGAEFDSYEVYRTVDSEIVFLLVVLTEVASERAVCVPAYYERSKAEGLHERADREGEIFTHVRRLRRDRIVTFTQADPGPFFPG